MANRQINRKIYKSAYKYLVEMAENNGISEKKLKKYFSPQKNDYNTLEDVFERLIISAQNAHMKPKIIKYYEKRDNIKKILFDFHVEKIVEKFDEENLYEKFCKKFDDCKGKIWLGWTKSVIDSARFIDEFESMEKFKYFVGLFDKNNETRWLLSDVIAYKIFGIGSTLACDFLKEIGYANFSKPDVHLLDVFSEMGLSERVEKDVFKAIGNMATICEVTPYQVDKIFWLICSGSFYLHDIYVNGEKEEFIYSLSK